MSFEPTWCFLKMVVEFLIGPLTPDKREPQIPVTHCSDVQNVLLCEKEAVLNGRISQSDLISIWNSFAQTSEQLNNRRHTTNAFFSTVFAASVSLFPQLWNYWSNSGFLQAVWLVSIIGIFASSFWISLLEQYEIVSKAKIEIMKSLENAMYIRVYTSQYTIVGKEIDRGCFKGFSQTETRLAYLARTSYVILFGVCSLRLLRLWHWL